MLMTSGACMAMTREEIVKVVGKYMVEQYFPKELEEARKNPHLDPYMQVLFLQGLAEASVGRVQQTEQQKAVVVVSPILIEQLSAIRNITPKEVEFVAERTFEWAAKNSKRINETFKKTKTITDRITKVHTNELRASVAQQILDSQRELRTLKQQAEKLRH